MDYLTILSGTEIPHCNRAHFGTQETRIHQLVIDDGPSVTRGEDEDACSRTRAAARRSHILRFQARGK